MLELIINKNNELETIALVENGKLVEKYQNTKDMKHNRLEGNIYTAKVSDIIPGMQAAFINYGDNKKGLIHFKDALPQINKKNNSKQEIISDITKILKPNQKILIQIKKDSNDKKGAKVSTHISIPSRYVVFMPNTDIITISQKIENEERKSELLNLITKQLPKNNGAVIRTSAENVDNKEIIRDLEKCINRWNKILNDYNKSDDIKLIYESETVQEKIIIDMNLDSVVTNNKEEFEKIKKLIEFEEIKKLKLEFKQKDNILDVYDLENQIEKSKSRKVWLNCGGFITIDKTEALVAIDVNTGKFTGKNDLENTVFKVNKEATIEIAKQLRLRDVGGIILIDYIDMHIQENKNKIESLLKEELKKDRAKTQVEGFTKLNLMELTRKHICSHLDEDNCMK